MSKQLIDLNAKLYRLGVRVENNRLRQVHPFTMTSFEVSNAPQQKEIDFGDDEQITTSSIRERGWPFKC